MDAKPILSSKMIGFNILVMVLSLLEAKFSVLAPYMSPAMYISLFIFVSLVNVYLRFKTNQAVANIDIANLFNKVMGLVTTKKE